MDLIESALHLALKAYTGQRDKAGKTYILHPLRLMHRMETEVDMATALLHDVLEDSDLGSADLEAAGIPAQVIEAVECLTRKEGESYEAFIERVAENPLATRVKLADLEDNIDVLRLPTLEEDDLRRVEKYHRAWRRLYDAPGDRYRKND